VGQGMRKRITFDELIDDLIFYVECPKCRSELVIDDIYKYVECAKCGLKFKPDVIYARKKGHDNPSLRGFSAGEKRE